MPKETEQEILKLCEEVIHIINEEDGILPTNRFPASDKGTDYTFFSKAGDTTNAYIAYLEKHIELYW